MGGSEQALNRYPWQACLCLCVFVIPLNLFVFVPGVGTLVLDFSLLFLSGVPSLTNEISGKPTFASWMT